MYFDLFDPVLYVFKGLPFIYGVSEDNAHGAPVVGLSDSFELFLASSVPNLQPDFVFADEYGFDFEIDADSGEVGSHEVVITELKQHVGFAHPAVTYYQ